MRSMNYAWGIVIGERFWRCLGVVTTTRRNGRHVLVQRWSTPCLSCGEEIVLVRGAPRGPQPGPPFQRTLCIRCSRIEAGKKRSATRKARRAAHREEANRARDTRPRLTVLEQKIRGITEGAVR